MGILNYLLNQRPENRRQQELHDMKLASYDAQKKALKAWQDGGMQGPPPPAPAVSSGGAPGATQVPPGSSGAPAADPLQALLGNADRTFSAAASNGGKVPDAGVPPMPGMSPANFSQGAANPMHNLVSKTATVPNLGETLVQQSKKEPQTSLSSSYEPLKELAMAYIETGNPDAAKMGMELLNDVAVAEQGASQFDRSAGQFDRQLDDTDFSNATARINADESVRSGRFTRNDLFNENKRQFDEQMRYNYAGLDAERERNRLNNITVSSPFGKIQPGNYTPESLAEFQRTGDYSILEPINDPTAKFLSDMYELQNDTNSTRSRINSSLTYANAAERIELTGGWAGEAEEFWRRVTGNQDDGSLLRKHLNQMRNDTTLASLPPGVASDKDVQLALEGFIDVKNTDGPTTARFLRGMAKLDAIKEAEQQAMLAYAEKTGNILGFDGWYRQNREMLIAAKFQEYSFSGDTGTVVDGIEGNIPTYSPEVQRVLGNYDLGGTY